MELHLNGKRFYFKETVFNGNDCELKWQLSRTAVKIKGAALKLCKDEKLSKWRQILNNAQLIALVWITMSSSLPTIKFLFFISCLGSAFNRRKWFIFVFLFIKINEKWNNHCIHENHLLYVKFIWVILQDYNYNFFSFSPLHPSEYPLWSLSNDNSKWSIIFLFHLLNKFQQQGRVKHSFVFLLKKILF